MTASVPVHTIIAIDGPSGAGKSTVARRLADALGYRYVDSGALYRAVGWLVATHGIDPDRADALETLLARMPIELRFAQGHSEVWVDGRNVTAQVRGEQVGRAASAVATRPLVRQRVTAALRHLWCQADMVVEGRDIGSVVFPEATVKFFLDAAPEVRARRRYREMHEAGQEMSLAQVKQAVAARDAQDRSRTLAPLARAPDARVIDTSDLTVDDVVDIMLSEVRNHILRGNA